MRGHNMLTGRLVQSLDDDRDHDFIMDSFNLEGFNPDSVAADIRHKVAGCYVLAEDGEPFAVLTMYATGAGLEVRMGKSAPNRLAAAADEVLQMLEDIAEAVGKTEVIIYGRPGWIRQPNVRRAGYRPRWSAVSKRIQ